MVFRVIPGSGDGGKSERSPFRGNWQPIQLGFELTKTYVCVCCRALQGKGMIDLDDPAGPSYCVKCFTRRKLGDPCFHKGQGRSDGEDSAIALTRNLDETKRRPRSPGALRR